MLAKFKIKTIRTKLLVISGGLVTLLIAGFVTLNYLNSRQGIQDHRRQLLKNYSEDLITAMQNDCLKAYSLAELMAQMSEFKEALANQDRARLQELTLPLFQEIKGKLQLAQFQFHRGPHRPRRQAHEGGQRSGPGPEDSPHHR
jgi:hypothetical protein